MKSNVGLVDRIARAVFAVGLGLAAVAAPLPRLLRVLAFGAPALYLLGTVFFATCLGYRLLGRSTCPAALGR